MKDCRHKNVIKVVYIYIFIYLFKNHEKQVKR